MSSVSRYSFPITSPALFLGGLLWVAAFWLPVFETPERTITGYWVFATGWMGFAMFQFAWYANLLMLMAVILMYSAPLRATLLAAAGLLVATQAFWFDVLPGTATSTEITGQGIGFWFWYGSIFLLGLGVVFGSDDVAPEEDSGAEEVVGVPDDEVSSVTTAEPVGGSVSSPVPSVESALPFARTQHKQTTSSGVKTAVADEEPGFVIEEESPFIVGEREDAAILAKAQDIPQKKT